MMIKDFLKENPKFNEILERALEQEEKNAKKEIYLGWEWDEVRAYPTELMKLVRDGFIKINYKSKRYTNYLLTDKESIRKALEK